MQLLIVGVVGVGGCASAGLLSWWPPWRRISRDEGRQLTGAPRMTPTPPPSTPAKLNSAGRAKRRKNSECGSCKRWQKKKKDKKAKRKSEQSRVGMTAEYLADFFPPLCFASVGLASFSTNNKDQDITNLGYEMRGHCDNISES